LTFERDRWRSYPGERDRRGDRFWWDGVAFLFLADTGGSNITDLAYVDLLPA
jgi:hypothetical protein